MSTTKKRKVSDKQIKDRLNECVHACPPPDNWKRAVLRLRAGQICCVVQTDREIHVIFATASCTLEEMI